MIIFSKGAKGAVFKMELKKKSDFKYRQIYIFLNINFTIMKQFTASNFRGDCTIDDDFESTAIKINEIAQKYNITVNINSSYRVDANVQGAIVKPATHSNHMIGHAIDCNLEYQGNLYNSTLMQSDTGIVRQFIDELKTNGIRWGGDFGKPDPVHFDDGLNINDMTAWMTKYNEIHGIEPVNLA